MMECLDVCASYLGNAFNLLDEFSRFFNLYWVHWMYIQSESRLLDLVPVDTQVDTSNNLHI